MPLLLGVIFLNNTIPVFADEVNTNNIINIFTNTYWQRDGDLGKKIAVLDTNPVQNLPIPVLLGVEPMNLTKNFGDPRDGGARTHEGLDIMAPKGTPIVSPTAAVVTGIGTQESAGLYVYTSNPGGERFGYMHLSAFAPGIERGTVLAEGDLIGFVGNTGNASGGASHLHFEIVNNGATDPYPRLVRSFSLQERMESISKFLPTLPNKSEATIFLAGQFKTTFSAAQTNNIVLPVDINSVLGSMPTSLASSVSPVSVPVQNIGTNVSVTKVIVPFTRNLTIGSYGEDVRALQKFLNANGYTVSISGAGSSGSETNYFGLKTKAALAKYQASENIYPAIGYFGPITRGYIT